MIKMCNLKSTVIAFIYVFFVVLASFKADAQSEQNMGLSLKLTEKAPLNIVDGYDDRSIINPVKLTEEEKKWIIEHPVIRVGVDPLWAPIEFVGVNNEAEGISIQYLELLESILGLEFEVSKTRSWLKVLEDLDQAQVDLLPAISLSHAKRQSFHFTKSYLSSPNGIFSAMNETYLDGVGALKGKKVAVVEGYASHVWLKDNHPELDLVTSHSVEEALKKVSAGDAFAFIGNLITTSYYIGETGLTQIRLVGEITYKNELAMAVRKDWKILSTILNKGIDVIPESRKKAIYNSWISIKYQHHADYNLLWQLLVITLLILSIILYWNHRLTREINCRREIEGKLIIAKSEAEQATQSKSEFLANMSHEIRTPLNAVIGLGHLIRKTELTAQQNNYIERMHASSEVLLDVIDDILDFSKGEADKLNLDLVDFILRDSIQNIIDIFYLSVIEKGLNFQLHIGANVPSVLVGDPQKIAQILRNFISNAIKFTEEGTIKVFVELLELNNGLATLNFSVCDSGIGISSQSQECLFKPFTQADSSITRNFGGTGLGLIICQQLSDLMEGDICLKSELGEGSTFTFMVSLGVSKVSSEKIIMKASKKNNLEKLSLRTIKILVVEDDFLNQLLTKEYLLSFGATVTLVNNGKIALEVLRENQFDIVLMDLQMPILDGYKATRLIRLEKKWKNLPIIALTAHALNSEQLKCYEAGMNDYITKPIDPDHLQETISKWLVPNDN